MYADQLKALLAYNPDAGQAQTSAQQNQAQANSQNVSPTLRQEDAMMPEEEIPWYKKLGTTLGLYEKPETRSPYANRVEGQ